MNPVLSYRPAHMLALQATTPEKDLAPLIVGTEGEIGTPQRPPEQTELRVQRAVKWRDRAVGNGAEADHDTIPVEHGDGDRPVILPGEGERPRPRRLHHQRVAVKAIT